MRRVLRYAVFVLALSTPWFLHPAWADNMAYVLDTGTVNLRSGPTTGYRVMADLSAGTQVTVLGQRDGWSQVQYTRPDGTTLKGWVLTRFLTDHSPWTAQVKALNASLHQKIDGMTAQRAALMQKQQQLTQQLQTTSAQLTTLQAKYDALQTDAASYGKLKSKYQSTKARLTAAQQKAASLNQKLEKLKLARRIEWFIAGALILLCGWLIGMSMGRYQKKRRSGFHM